MAEFSIGIVIKDNKILMVKRAKKEVKMLWVFPGGKVKEGEINEQACISKE